MEMTAEDRRGGELFQVDPDLEITPRETVAEDSGAIYQTLELSLLLQGASTLTWPALNAIERLLSSIILRQVDSLDQSEEVAQTSSAEGEITTYKTFPVVFKRACMICLAINAPLDSKALRCGHVMCRDCVQMRFKMAIHHECSYPPKCCYIIPVEEVESLLDEASIQLYQKKEIEYQSTNRTYCHNWACQKFVPPEQITCGVAPCEDCKHIYLRCLQRGSPRGRMRRWRGGNTTLENS